MLSYLDIHPPSPKPREARITHVIDRGIGIRQAQDLVETSGHFIDILKLGWGTGYITPILKDKIKLYQEHGLSVCFGGTLFEVSVLNGKFDEFRDMLHHLELSHVEVSDGTITLTPEEKFGYIQELAKDFVVLSEVGSKDPTNVIAPHRWIQMIQADLEAGAWKVVTEARESGTAGIYRRDGEVRFGLIDEILTKINPEHLLFEAPNKDQQLWLIEKLGCLVNLGNISVDDVIPLETLRLGLRSDTLLSVFSEES